MKRWLFNVLRHVKSGVQEIPALPISRVFSYDEYNHRSCKAERSVFEQSLISDGQKEFTVNGYCYVCKIPSKFLVDFLYSYKVDGVLMPNWRERLVCSNCQLVNRCRATLHLFEEECKPTYGSKIYITEQLNPLYSLLKKRYPETIGSEYIGYPLTCGACNENGVRNEDLTDLSFGNNEFDFILSFDVLEHIPKYRNALLECFRCLKPEGIFFFSVPFSTDSEKNIVRATIDEHGNIEHILTPEYHGDPMSSEGVLCYSNFGWELLADLKEVGFVDVQALFYWSKELGYLGEEQVQFKATKSNLPRRKTA